MSTKGYLLLCFLYCLACILRADPSGHPRGPLSRENQKRKWWTVAPSASAYLWSRTDSYFISTSLLNLRFLCLASTSDLLGDWKMSRQRPLMPESPSIRSLCFSQVDIATLVCLELECQRGNQVIPQLLNIFLPIPTC